MTNAGWYPDPAGAPDTYRYWDGQSWSQMTTTQPPGGTAPQAPSGPPSGQAWPPSGEQPATQMSSSPPPYGGPPSPPQQPQQPQQYGAVPTPSFPPQPGQPGQSGGPGQPGQPGGPGPDGQPAWSAGPQQGGGNGGRIALIAVAAVLVLTLLAVGGFFGFRALSGDDDDNDKKADKSDKESSDTTPSESTSESSTIRPTGIQCTGGGEQSTTTPAPGTKTLSGGGLTVPVPSGYTYDGKNAGAFTFGHLMVAAWKLISDNWVSEYAVGGLPLDNGYESTEQAAEIVMQCLTMSDDVYSGFESRTDLKNESITVDGKDAHLITAEIRVNDPQITEEGDVTTVIIVDTGSSTEYGVYLGIVPIGDSALIAAQEAQIQAIKVG